MLTLLISCFQIVLLLLCQLIRQHMLFVVSAVFRSFVAVLFSPLQKAIFRKNRLKNMLIPRILNSATKSLIYNGLKAPQFTPVYQKFFYSTKTKDIEGENISIGDVTCAIKPPKNPELVPQKYSKFFHSWKQSTKICDNFPFQFNMLKMVLWN